MSLQKALATALSAALTMGAFAAPSVAQKPKKATKQRSRPAPNRVVGQAQLAGANGQFGVVYSLNDGFNFAILGARYTVEPFECADPMTAGTDTKLLVLELAIKNAKPEDNWFSMDDLVTLVDSRGRLYTKMSNAALQSKGNAAVDRTLRPGQGLGQRELNDPLRVAMPVPNDARVVKIMVNRPRRGTTEKVLRYYIAGATQAEAGEQGDPKNVIAGLPAEVRDPEDPSGAVALTNAGTVVGRFVASAGFAVRVDKVAVQNESPTEERETTAGERYLVCTLTGKLLISGDNYSMYELVGDEPSSYEVVLSDGERITPFVYRHATRDAAPTRSLQKGDEATCRAVFGIPADAVVKALVFGARDGRRWTLDLKGTL